MGSRYTSWGPCWRLLQDDGVGNFFRLSMAGKGSQRQVVNTPSQPQVFWLV